MSVLINQQILNFNIEYSVDFPGGSVVMNLPANAGHVGLIPGSRRSCDPVEEEMAPTPVFLSEKFHGQRSLDDYSP